MQHNIEDNEVDDATATVDDDDSDDSDSYDDDSSNLGVYS